MARPMILRSIFLLVCLLSLGATTAWSTPASNEHQSHQESAIAVESAADSHDHARLQAASTTDTAIDVGLEEKLGAIIPLDLTFLDEAGEAVRLKDLVDRPTVIAPVYFKCPNVCNFLQSSLVDVLPQVKMTPGEDFRVLSISFDETEGPTLASRSKKAYYHALGGDYPQDGWRFLTGDLTTIRQLTDGVGYKFQRQGVDFLHPVSLVVVSPTGKIVRYLHGTHVLPMDFNLALIEAGEGRVSPPIRKMLTFCFSYDPEGKRYVFNILRVSATGILLAAGSLFLYLVITGRRKKQR